MTMMAAKSMRTTSDTKSVTVNAKRPRTTIIGKVSAIVSKRYVPPVQLAGL